DKKRIVSVSHDGMVRIWNAETFDSEDPFRVEGGPLIGAALSADSRLLACADNAGKVTLWDLVGKQQKTEFTHHSRGARLALSSDGTQLAAAWHLVNEKGDDLPGEVTVWDLSGKRPQRDFPGHTRYVSSLAFNHDGTQLASGSRE